MEGTVTNSYVNTTTAVLANYSVPDYGPIEIAIPVVFGLICLFGVVGNSLVIYVILKHNKMKTVANVYILSLAIADLFFMFTIPFIAYQQATFEWPFGFAWCKVVMAVDGLNQTTGIYCLTAMAIDRYLAIVHPIRSMKVRTVNTAIGVNISIWFLSTVTVMPLWLYTKTTVNPSSGLTVCGIKWPNQAMNTAFIIYMFVSGLVCPVIVILVCYLLMIRRLYTGVGPIGESDNKRPTKKVARMVLTVIFVFVVCWTPFYVIQLYVLDNPSDTYRSKEFVITFYFTLCISYFNSSVNPLIYSFMSENFRKCFLSVLKCKRLHDADIDANTKQNRNSGGRDGGGSIATIATDVNVDRSNTAR
ncbi:somatostatin receptor type 2-like [Glandiceps talaboti]